jgi:hypothetical protein
VVGAGVRSQDQDQDTLVVGNHLAAVGKVLGHLGRTAEVVGGNIHPVVPEEDLQHHKQEHGTSFLVKNYSP